MKKQSEIWESWLSSQLGRVGADDVCCEVRGGLVRFWDDHASGVYPIYDAVKAFEKTQNGAGTQEFWASLGTFCDEGDENWKGFADRVWNGRINSYPVLDQRGVQVENGQIQWYAPGQAWLYVDDQDGWDVLTAEDGFALRERSVLAAITGGEDLSLDD